VRTSTDSEYYRTTTYTWTRRTQPQEWGSTFLRNVGIFSKRWYRNTKVQQLINNCYPNCIIPLKTKFNVTCTRAFSSYRAVNTFRLGYTNESVNAV